MKVYALIFTVGLSSGYAKIIGLYDKKQKAEEIKEKHYKEISGVSLKNIYATATLGKKCIELCEDLLFTHRGISGPLSYKVSSLFSQNGYSENNPIIIKLNFIPNADLNLQKLLEKNSQKEILTLISEFMPKSLAKTILTYNNINPQKKCYEINKTERIILEKHLSELKLEVINPLKEGEIVEFTLIETAKGNQAINVKEVLTAV